MKTGRFVSVVLCAVLIAAAACGCQKSETLESWAYSYESGAEALKLCNNGTAVFDGNDYTYTKDNDHINLKDKSGQELKMRYTVSGDEMTLYKVSSYTLNADYDADGLIGVWNCGNSAFEFTDKGTFLEDNIFPGHFLVDEEAGTMRTYIVRDNRSSELVGYFSIKAGLISYNEHDVAVVDETTGKEKIDEATGETVMRRVFDTLPGVELADFAVNQAYIKNHPDLKGVGLVIYDKFILPVIRKAAETIGIKLFTCSLCLIRN